MILLSADCLLFVLPDGHSIPLRPDMIAFEISGLTSSVIDAETVNHAAAAVFHYFKHDLGRDSVTMGEFTAALEKILHGFALKAGVPREGQTSDQALETDLPSLAAESGGSELFFFSKLRDELRTQLRQSPATLRFHGLRRCVKQLSGARRWSGRCRSLRDQIVDYLRGCLEAEAKETNCSLLVE